VDVTVSQDLMLWSMAQRGEMLSLLCSTLHWVGFTVASVILGWFVSFLLVVLVQILAAQHKFLFVNWT